MKSMGITGEPVIMPSTGDTASFSKLADDYVKAQKKLWIRHSTAGITLDAAKNMQTSSCLKTVNDPINGMNGTSGYDRLGYILPKTVNKIVLLPSCLGLIMAYTRCVQYIKANEDDANTAFIFMPPFYSPMDTAVSENRTMFFHFIAMKRRMADTGKASVHILSDYMQNTVNNACALTQGTTQENVLPMLEPTYILYPYTRVIDTSNVSGILFSASAQDEVILPASNNSSKSGLLDAAQKGVVGGHAWPCNTAKLDPLLNSANIPYRRYRFFSNKGNTDMLSNEKLTIITLNSNAPAVTAATSIDETPDTKFKSSDKAFLTGVSYTSVPLGANLYSLRHPRNPEVQTDWENTIFTDDEAAFLNDLNLRPGIMASIYKNRDVSWKYDLAKNLATIVRSKCFTDSRLVLHSDCQTSQKFITDILNYFVVHDDRIESLEKDEAEAEKVALRLKVDKAVASVTTSAVDTTKDPFVDGLLRKTGQTFIDPNMDFSIIANLASNTYSRAYIVINKVTGDKVIGEMICNRSECKSREEVEDKFDAIYNKIKNEYTGFSLAP